RSIHLPGGRGRSVHSRPVAISAGWASPARPVGTTPARAVGASARGSAPSSELSAVRTAARAIVARSVGPGSFAPRSVVPRPVVSRTLVPATVSFWTGLRRWRLMHFRRAALGTLPLEQPQRGGRQLRGVEFPEQGLERNHFAG